MAINYKKTTWNDNATRYTPINPTRLNNIENALKSACDFCDSVSRGVVDTGGRDLSAWGNFAFCEITVSIGRTMPNTSYAVLATAQADGVPAGCSVRRKTTTSFTLYVFTTSGITHKGFLINWLVVG